MHAFCSTTHSELYSCSDEMVQNFGFASNFEKLYEVQERIGEGTFGVVHVATDRRTGQR